MTFTFLSDTHDIQKFPNKAAFDACDFSRASGALNTGNNYELTVLTGTNYYGCSKYGHCSERQKIEITAAADPPYNSYVPLPALENIHAYVATLAPFGLGSTVKGEFLAFASGTEVYPMVAVAGEFTGLEANLNNTQCLKAKNGCGIHIHSGQSCASTDLQARARSHIARIVLSAAPN